MNGEVLYWPLIMGWSIVACLYLFGWKRQAVITTAGMAIVTVFVISAGYK